MENSIFLITVKNTETGDEIDWHTKLPTNNIRKFYSGSTSATELLEIEMNIIKMMHLPIRLYRIAKIENESNKIVYNVNI